MSHLVTASLIVETTPGKIRSAAELMSAMANVTVHNFEGYKIIVTIEAANMVETQEIEKSLRDVDGVIDVNVVYAESLDDPSGDVR